MLSCRSGGNDFDSVGRAWLGCSPQGSGLRAATGGCWWGGRELLNTSYNSFQLALWQRTRRGRNSLLDYAKITHQRSIWRPALKETAAVKLAALHAEGTVPFLLREVPPKLLPHQSEGTPEGRAATAATMPQQGHSWGKCRYAGAGDTCEGAMAHCWLHTRAGPVSNRAAGTSRHLPQLLHLLSPRQRNFQTGSKKEEICEWEGGRKRVCLIMFCFFPIPESAGIRGSFWWAVN